VCVCVYVQVYYTALPSGKKSLPLAIDKKFAGESKQSKQCKQCKVSE